LTELRKRRRALGLSISGVSHEVRVNTSVLSWVELRKLAASPAVRTKLSDFYGEEEGTLFDTTGMAK